MGKGNKHGNGQQQNQGQQDPQELQDKEMRCGEKDCPSGGTFIWTAGEQDFYAQKGFDTPPKRCKPCRDARKAAKQDQR